jgi:hypothetical protein
MAITVFAPELWIDCNDSPRLCVRYPHKPTGIVPDVPGRLEAGCGNGVLSEFARIRPIDPIRPPQWRLLAPGLLLEGIEMRFEASALVKPGRTLCPLPHIEVRT